MTRTPMQPSQTPRLMTQQNELQVIDATMQSQS